MREIIRNVMVPKGSQVTDSSRLVSWKKNHEQRERWKWNFIGTEQ
jgi:hypothetical protein